MSAEQNTAAATTVEKTPVVFPVDEAALEQYKLFQAAVYVCTVVAKVALLVYNLAAVQKYLVPYATQAFERAQTFAVDINKKYAATTKATETLDTVQGELQNYAIWRETVEPRAKQAFEVVSLIQTRAVEAQKTKSE